MTLINKLIYRTWEKIDSEDLPQWIIKDGLPKNDGQTKEYNGLHFKYVVIKHKIAGIGNGHPFSIYGFEAYRKVKT
jgi:hypothetical protein